MQPVTCPFERAPSPSTCPRPCAKWPGNVVRDEVPMKRLGSAYDYALGLRELETDVADSFEAEFPVVTGRTVKLIESVGDPPDRVALIDGMETGVELTAIHAGSADDIVAEVLRLARQKHDSYTRRGVFDRGPMILLGHLDWPAPDVEGPALYDVWEEPCAFAELKPTRQPISANAAAETNFMLSPLCVSLRRPGEPVGRASPARQPDSTTWLGFLGACREISDGLTLLPLRDSLLVDPVALSEGSQALLTDLQQ